MNKSKWIECALSAGFESFEIIEEGKKEKQVEWFQGAKERFVTSSVTSLTLRGVYEGHMAKLKTEDESDENMEQVICDMKELAQAITSEEVSEIRAPQEISEVPDNGRIWKKPGQELIEKTLAEVEKKLLAFDERIFQAMEMQWDEETTTRAITNSKGIDLKDETTVQIIVAGVAAKAGEEIKNGFNVKVVEDLESFDVDAFVKETCTKVLDKLGSASLKSGIYKVILDNKAMTTLFTALTDMFSGDLVGKGISPLTGKIGEQVFSEKITIVDDPFCKEAVYRPAFDNEGCPTSRKVLVENGVVKGVLHDTKSAAKMGVESTGNGYSGVRPMNSFIVPGSKSLEQMCEEMGEGLVITDFQGIHAGLDHVTTDFSLQSNGYLISGGKRVRSVSLITTAANYLDMMKHVVEVGNDIEWNYHMVACPSVAFEGCSIAGE